MHLVIDYTHLQYVHYTFFFFDQILPTTTKELRFTLILHLDIDITIHEHKTKLHKNADPRIKLADKQLLTRCEIEETCLRVSDRSEFEKNP